VLETIACISDLCKNNLTVFWAAVLAESFARMGIDQAVVSPGSRVAPLSFALLENSKIKTHVVLDERSAAFVALGIAKVTGRPVLLACTSGTAAANYFPAIIEAEHSRVPLIVITTDRPPELHCCGSEQTMSQEHLYGKHVLHFQNLPVAVEDLKVFQSLRQSVAMSVHTSLGTVPGPVHLNMPLRDPLAPLEIPSKALSALIEKIDCENFFGHLRAPQPLRATMNISEVLLELRESERGIIAVGPYTDTTLDRDIFIASAYVLAKYLGWPILADAMSPLRHAGGKHVIAHYGHILKDVALANDLKPTYVLSVGRLPTNKSLRDWLENVDARTILFEASGLNEDAHHRRCEFIGVGIDVVASQIQGPARGDSNYWKQWGSAETQFAQKINQQLSESEDGFEPAAARALAHGLPVETPVLICTSMPIRHAEGFWPVTDKRFQPYANRGVNGIDGLVSTAVGLALGKKRPTVALIGDLSTLHDTNGLLCHPLLSETSLTLVMINNDGGRIFEYLPISAIKPFVDTHIITPQAVDFERLASAYGPDAIGYRRFKSWRELQKAVAVLPRRGLHLWEFDVIA
jgi:2-succinyl-5-enolpyruvyl-6-hydroxy-3-cyclohexene-1-carboxylate synthase